MGWRVARRAFLKTLGASAAMATGGLGGARWARAAAAEPGWRTFEVTTRLEVTDPVGTTRAWVPLPLTVDTDYQRRLAEDVFTGNAKVARIERDPEYGASFLYAEWPEGEAAPVIEVVNRFATRDREVDLTRPLARPAKERREVLDLNLKPTKLIPTDGIVRERARAITRGQRTDVAKARAIYEWVVENTFRDPKVRGCGLGDIRFMLESGDLGGKCADLNALFVGLARAAGVPARDVYGIRVADSREFKSLGKSGDITKAQHCRAEFYSESHGWVPVDPADVRKVVLEEPPGGRPLDDPLVRRARAKLFGAWEMNYLAYNYAHDLALPNSSGEPIGFLMYPQAETGKGRKDSLEPGAFKYQITSRELSAA